MTLYYIVLYLIITLTALSALAVLFTNKIMDAALALIICLVGVAGVYVFLQADFIAVTQLFVYVGGVLVLLLFGIMLSNEGRQSKAISKNRNALAVIVGLIVFYGIVYSILNTDFDYLKEVPGIEAQRSTTQAIGIKLMTEYLFPFEIVAVLLLIALIASVYIVSNKKTMDK